MPIDLADASRIRNILHNLDLRNEEHKEVYDNLLFQFIKCFETNKEPDLLAYRDPKKFITIGYGFNMSDDGPARKFWSIAFKGEDMASMFDNIKSGKMAITKEQALKLYHTVIEEKRNELKNIYKPHWDKFKPNEQLMLEDLYYNSGNKIIGKGKTIHMHMMNYAATGDAKHLKAAIEMVKKSNGENANIHEGIQKRRNAEAELGNSTKCPLYEKPGEKIINGVNKIYVKPNDAAIPRKTGDLRQDCTESNRYYIWRTMLDNKVRKEHLLNEGKIFDDQHPPAEGNPGDRRKDRCRCIADYFIPNWLIIDNIQEKQILRKHLALTDFPNFIAK